MKPPQRKSALRNHRAVLNSKSRQNTRVASNQQKSQPKALVKKEKEKDAETPVKDQPTVQTRRSVVSKTHQQPQATRQSRRVSSSNKSAEKSQEEDSKTKAPTRSSRRSLSEKTRKESITQPEVSTKRGEKTKSRFRRTVIGTLTKMSGSDDTVKTSEPESAVATTTPDLDIKQEARKEKAPNEETPEKQNADTPTENTTESDQAATAKKLKGSLSIKFKSWNWTKQDMNNRPKSESKEPFLSSDEEEGDGEATTKQKAGEPVIVEQNNQKLFKCRKCLLYIPQVDYDFHETGTCEALQTGDGRDYTCSECLAAYPSQKLLVRHKRECPKRSQSMYRYQTPRDTGKALEGMYSVVWKCHCKQSFKSSEDLGKHRLKCSFAQNYTVTCPICNSRIMGGQRVLRYHMSKNHPSLFLPDEVSSASILNSLDGGSPMSQVITTQTTNVNKIVKKLSREHQGANIRVVTLPKQEPEDNVNREPEKSIVKVSGKVNPVMKVASTNTPETKKINIHIPATLSRTSGTMTPIAVSKTTVAMAVSISPGVATSTGNMIPTAKLPMTSTPKMVVKSPPQKFISNVRPTANTKTVASAVTAVNIKQVAKTKPESKAKVEEPELSRRKSARKRKAEENSSEAQPEVNKPQTQTTSSTKTLAAVSKKVPESKPGAPVLARTSLRGKGKREQRDATEKVPKVTEKTAPNATATKPDPTPPPAKKPARANVKETKATSQETPSQGPTSASKAEKKESEDLRNLLEKARALTRELEEKLNASSNTPSRNTDQHTEAEKETGEKQSSAGQASAKKQSSVAEKNATKKAANRAQPKARATKRKAAGAPNNTEQQKIPKKDAGKQARGVVQSPRVARRYTQVTCLDCRKVFKDHVQLGVHKRNSCTGGNIILDRTFSDTDIEALTAEGSKNKTDISECYYCTLCPSKFGLRSQLSVHMRDEHQGGLSQYLNYHCPFCPRVFQTTFQRHSHKTERHSDLLNIPLEDEFGVQGVVSCDKCHGVFHKREMHDHPNDCGEKIVKTERSSFCQLCGLVLENDEDLKLHRQKNHLSAIHFRCGQCTRTFGHALELRCHKVSNHSRALKMDQVLHEMKRLETRKNLKMGKSIKIHISPATEFQRDLMVSPNEASLTPTKPTTTTKKPATAKPSTSKESAKKPGKTTTPVRSTKCLPITPIRAMKQGKSPVQLTSKVMEMLSKGQSVKLVIPKSTDMRKLSFSVPSQHGKFKKFSLSPKVTDAGETSTVTQSQDSGDGKKSPQPQRMLAAALGLQPKDPSNPEAGVARLHRPTRLRSGKTIVPTGESISKKEKGDKCAEPSVTPEVAAARDIAENQPNQVGNKPITGESVEMEVTPTDTQNPTVGSQHESNNTNDLEVSLPDQIVTTDPSNDTENISTGQITTDKPTEQIVETSVKMSEELPTTQVSEVVSVEPGNTESAQSRDVLQPVQSPSCTTSPMAGTQGTDCLTPVQVLRPIGNDRVQCMRCNQILGSMLEVANHKCAL